MTAYKIKKVVEDSTTNGIRVVRWQVLGFLATREDAERFARSYRIEYPTVVLKAEELEVRGDPENEEKETIAPEI
jgi:hypothetical protein